MPFEVVPYASSCAKMHFSDDTEHAPDELSMSKARRVVGLLSCKDLNAAYSAALACMLCSIVAEQMLVQGGACTSAPYSADAAQQLSRLEGTCLAVPPCLARMLARASRSKRDNHTQITRGREIVIRRNDLRTLADRVQVDLEVAREVKFNLKAELTKVTAELNACYQAESKSLGAEARDQRSMDPEAGAAAGASAIFLAAAEQ
eukprot:6204350-Pleurochrysis_carterae.AAC.1